MSTPREYQTSGIIIRKTKLGEADRILTVYTPELGKFDAVAKGVRRPKSKMAGHLELLTYSQLTLARGRSLDIITGSQTIESFLPLKNDLWLMSYGLYVIELVNQFTAIEVPDEDLFQLALTTLRQLCQSDNRDLLLRYFEIQLLQHSGYRPQLRECVACHQVLQPVNNSFSASNGGILCPSCAARQPFAHSITVNAIKVLRFIQDNSLESVLKLKINPILAREIEGVTRGYLKYLLEREVKSVAWLDDLREQMRVMVNKKVVNAPDTGDAENAATEV
ncbi:MAG: DNA repair protein RecO [Dehalococcoidales bacterium]|nr:DNA repair protein RecO [Dehalococcoidales bacterium]